MTEELFKDEKTRLADAEKIRDRRLTELERKQALLEATALPIAAAFLKMAIAKLTHFHTPRMDELLIKVGPPNILTDEELKELTILREERMVEVSDKVDESEKIIAKILPDLIALEKLEAVKLKEDETTEVILVKQPKTEISSNIKGDLVNEDSDD